MPKSFSRMRLLNILFWFGLCLNIVGIAVGFGAGQWSAVALGLMLLGCACLGGWLFGRWRWSAQSMGSWWRGRSLQAGTNALLSTLAILVIVGLINFLAARYSGQLDLTENQVFSLAPQTVQVVKTLKEPLRVLVFDDNPPPQHRTLLEQYQRLNPDRFIFRFVDPQVEIGLAIKYGVRTAGEVVLESGDRTKTLQLDFKEVTLTPELISLVGEQPKAYFLQGHGELPIAGEQANLAEAVAALQREGFETELLSLIETKVVPEDAKVLIVASPQRQYGAAEIKLLQAYLEKGGNLLLMLDPDTEHGLDGLLRTWGVTLDRRLVLDTTSQPVGLGPAVPLVFEYGNHPITEGFELPTLFPRTQAVIGQERPNLEVTMLLTTGQSSWAEAEPENEQLEFDAERDLQGPLTIGVAIRRNAMSEPRSSSQSPAASPVPAASPQAKPSAAGATVPSDSEETAPESPAPDSETTKKAPESRLVVIGDADFAISGFFNDPRVANSDLFLNSVTWLGSEKKPVLAIRPKENTDRKLTLQPQRQQQLFVLGMLLPVGALATAAALWWQRR